MYKYDNARIQLNSAKGIFSVDVLGNELAVDTFSAVVRYNPDAPLAYSPSNATKAYVTANQPEEEGNKVIYLVKKSADIGATYLHRAGWGTPVWWYVGGRVMAKGYMSKVERISRNMYRMTCMSGIGLLDNKMHTGGLYNRTAASTILASIIGGLFGYSVAEDVAATEVNGWLPYDTARNNLHALLFALGAAMTRKANGDYLIEFLADSVTSVPSGRVALGGKVEYTVPIDGVEVTEHSFFTTSGDEEVTLYDTGSIYADNLTIVFGDAPVHDLRTTGTLTVVTSHVNYAVINGTGTLLGKKYTHTIRNVTVGGGVNNIKRVETNYLVSYANSYAIAKRVFQYYTTAKRIEAKILLDWEKNGETVTVNPGTRLSLRDGYGDPTTAYLSAMDVLVTSVKGANCKLISGFVPGAGGNNFTHRVIITRNSNFRIPTGINFMRIVAISGGDGGQGGYDGQPGQGGVPTLVDPDATKSLLWYFDQDHEGQRNSRYATWYWSRGQQPTAEGGAVGAPGASGRILIADITVTGGATCPCVIGKGGAGGERNGELGEAGGDTQITVGGTVYTTANGLPNEYGYYDAFADVMLALPGESGHRGGNGGRVDVTNDIGNNGTAGGKGGNVGTYKGGAGGAGKIWVQSTTYDRSVKASGGPGGGAAWGAPGGAGGVPTVRDETHTATTTTGGFFTAGKPGNGANALAPTKPTYGNGGGGGNGGGAGGNVSGIQCYYWYDVGYEEVGFPWADISLGTGDAYATAPEPKDRDCGGKGGLGSPGGDGGDGCIIIYY
jgi:hypothetical protein